MTDKENAPACVGAQNRGGTENLATAKLKGYRSGEISLIPGDFQQRWQQLSAVSGRPAACPEGQAEDRAKIRSLPGNCRRNRSSGGFGPAGMALMVDPRRLYRSLPVLPQAMINHLLGLGVHPLAIGSGANPPLKPAWGLCATDGWFDADDFGFTCYAVPIDDGGGVIDLGFWDARTGDTARLLKCGFALGEEQIDSAGTYSFGGHLRIHASPIGWLRSGRDGIFVLDWGLAFDRLRYCPRIAIDACLLPTYREAMQPLLMPELFVIADDKEAA